MRSELKTAVIMGVIIASGLGVLGVYFTSLEQTSQNQIGSIQTASSVDLNIDKSGFKKAPQLEGISGYINTNAQEFTDQLKGKVVVYDIWTYSCINCQRTLPYITAWNEKYADQ
jgi:thiol-disulfide isomerase/thioredoxin